MPISRAVVLNWEIGELFDLNTDASSEVTDETAKLGSYIYMDTVAVPKFINGVYKVN